MSIQTAATVADLYTLPDNQKAEIIDGRICLMSPTGFLPNYAAGEIFVSLRQYARQTGHGFAIGDNAGFIVDLPHRKSFSPDAAFHTGEPTGMKFLDGAPIFAAEVRSEGDYGTAAEQALAQKRADYFAAGTIVVWDVDLLNEDVIRAYHKDSPAEPIIFRRREYATAETALPGWRMWVDDLFPAELASI